MAPTPPKRVDLAKLRKETREWLKTKTIPNAREIARELENAGEDVHDLLASIEELEALLEEEPAKPAKRPSNAEA